MNLNIFWPMFRLNMSELFKTGRGTNISFCTREDLGKDKNMWPIFDVMIFKHKNKQK
jgi:hypothetical protein